MNICKHYIKNHSPVSTTELAILLTLAAITAATKAAITAHTLT
jgi:hypothetical protein